MVIDTEFLYHPCPLLRTVIRFLQFPVNAFCRQHFQSFPQFVIDCTPERMDAHADASVMHPVNERFHHHITGQIPQLPVFRTGPEQMPENAVKHHMEIHPVHQHGIFPIEICQIMGFVCNF